MIEPAPAAIRIGLRWIQILESLEPFFASDSQFRFVASVTGPSGGLLACTHIPETGHLRVSSRIGENRLHFDTTLYHGPVPGSITLEIRGEEVDLLSPNDPLPAYRRTFDGDPSGWIGWYGPGDETPGADPESLGAWRVCYVVEAI